MTDTHCNYMGDKVDFEFEDKFEILEEEKVIGDDILTGEIPFSACTPAEISHFFYMSSAPDSSTSFIVDRGYECHTSRCNDPLPLGLEWSILTPNPSYTTHAPETFKENRLFLYTDGYRSGSKNNTCPTDNDVSGGKFGQANLLRQI